MSRDDITRMAREAGIVVTGEAVWKLCELVAAAEREACRRAFDAYLLTSDPGPLRARGQA